MADYTYSDSDPEFRSEVRDALAQIDATQIPDATIDQKRARIAAPHLTDQLENGQQRLFDDALILFTAELAFKGWLTETRYDDNDIQVKVNVEQYTADLEEQTNMVFARGDITRPDYSSADEGASFLAL